MYSDSVGCTQHAQKLTYSGLTWSDRLKVYLNNKKVLAIWEILIENRPPWSESVFAVLRSFFCVGSIFFSRPNKILNVTRCKKSILIKKKQYEKVRGRSKSRRVGVFSSCSRHIESNNVTRCNSHDARLLSLYFTIFVTLTVLSLKKNKKVNRNK